MICRGKACLARMNALIINDNGHDFRVVPVFDRFSPNVSHWAKNTHHRHTAGSITACHGALLHVLMCFVETRHALCSFLVQFIRRNANENI